MCPFYSIFPVKKYIQVIHVHYPFCYILHPFLANAIFGLMVSTQVRQSEGPGFKSGQIAYFHGVKTRISTLGTGDVPRGSDCRKKSGT